jgi:hypothetical protein
VTQTSGRRGFVARAHIAVAVVAVLVVAGCGGTTDSGAPTAAAAATAAAARPPTSVAADGSLGTVGPGGRLDAPAAFVAGGSQSLAYAFDVATGTGRLRVTLDLSNRDDCVELHVSDPTGREIVAPGLDYPTVCPSADRSGQAFDIEWSTIDPVAGHWRAAVNAIDAMNLGLRLRVSFDDQPATQLGEELYPDLVPWLPWEFGFAAPAGDTPGTAHDRQNQPGPSTVSCHPVEEAENSQCLRFSAGIYNVGAGPLYVSFRDDVAVQHVYERDATPDTFADNEAANRFTERPAGTGEWHEFHQHRHLAEFVLYELFRVTDGGGDLAPVDTGHKHGYCTFSQQVADWASTDQDPQYASFPAGTFCDDAMNLERGWGDIYRWQRPGQYVSYATVAEADRSMRAGRYVLRFTVDPANHIAEASERNNVGYALIEVRDGGGLGQDTVMVCEQGMGGDPRDPSRKVVPDRFEWAKRAADPGYVALACD